jgi:RNA polymerase sigma-70 factor (ECF subfamily)
MPLAEETIVRALFAARPRLSAAAWLITRDSQAAEDIFQNVSVKAITRGGPFEHEAGLLSWAHVAARREAIDWLRRRKPEVSLLDDDVMELVEAEWTVAPASGGARVDALRDCLQRAPADARQLLELRYFEGRSCDEVAAESDLGLAAVYQRLSRLHRALKVCIERRMAGGETVFNPNAS